MPRTRRAFKGGFWNNDLASESEIMPSGERVHRTRSYRRARRDSSRKKWKSRAWKAALASAALGTAYLGYKHRDDIAAGYNNTLAGINQGYADTKNRITGAYDEATGMAGDQIARLRGMPTREEIAQEEMSQAAKLKQEAEEAEMARQAYEERMGRRNSLYGHLKRTRRGTKEFLIEHGPGAAQGALNLGWGATKGVAGLGAGVLNGVAGVGANVLGGIAEYGPGALESAGTGIGNVVGSGIGLLGQGLGKTANGVMNYGPGAVQAVGNGIGYAGNALGTGLGYAGNALGTGVGYAGNALGTGLGYAGNSLAQGATSSAEAAAQAYAALAARKAAFDASRKLYDNSRALPAPSRNPTLLELPAPAQFQLPAPPVQKNGPRPSVHNGFKSRAFKSRR